MENASTQGGPFIRNRDNETEFLGQEPSLNIYQFKYTSLNMVVERGRWRR